MRVMTGVVVGLLLAVPVSADVNAGHEHRPPTILEEIDGAERDVCVVMADPPMAVIEALVRAREKRDDMDVRLVTDEAGWKHAKLLVYRGAHVSVVSSLVPVVVIDDELVDKDGLVTRGEANAERELFIVIGYVMRSI
jgi:hypothetical protein